MNQLLKTTLFSFFTLSLLLSSFAYTLENQNSYGKTDHFYIEGHLFNAIYPCIIGGTKEAIFEKQGVPAAPNQEVLLAESLYGLKADGLFCRENVLIDLKSGNELHAGFCKFEMNVDLASFKDKNTNFVLIPAETIKGLLDPSCVAKSFGAQVQPRILNNKPYLALMGSFQQLYLKGMERFLSPNVQEDFDGWLINFEY